MPSIEITEAEIRGVSEFLGSEVAHFTGHVLEGKTAKKAKNKRICVAGQFKLYIFNRGKDVKKAPKQIHYYDILELESDTSFSYVNITVREKGKPVTFSLVSDKCADLLWEVRNAYQLISLEFPSNSQLKIQASLAPASAPPSELLKGGGFLNIYEAQCAYFNATAHREFVQYVSGLISQGVTTLDLTHCPGIEPKSDITLDLLPVFAALRYNTYFRGVVLVDVERREAIHLLADTLRYNTYLTSVQISNVNGEEKSFILLGQNLKDNKNHAVQVLDVSGNNIGSKGMIALAEAIQAWPHALKVLNIGHGNIGAKGIVALIAAFEKSYGVSLTIEDLNLSGNTLSSHAAPALETWFSNVKSYSRLVHLSLAKSSIPFNLFASLKFFTNITELDMSHNKIDATEGCRVIAFICESSAHLKKINFSSCSLTSPALEPIIEALLGNVKLTAVDFNISNNNLGDKGINYLTGILPRNKFSELDISGIKLKEKSFTDFVEAASQLSALRRLVLKGVFSKNTSARDKMTPVIVEALQKLLQNKSIAELYLSNGYGQFIILPLMKTIQQSATLQVLDISNNALGDRGGYILAEFIRTSLTPKLLKIDDNRISINGFYSISEALNQNKATWFPFPRLDSDKVFQTLSPDRASQFLQIVVNIIQKLTRTAPPNVFIFDEKLHPTYQVPTTIEAFAKVPEYLANLKATITLDNVPDFLPASASRSTAEIPEASHPPPVPSIEDSLPPQASSYNRNPRSPPPPPQISYSEWEKTTTDEGDEYWYNTITGESRWTNPHERPEESSLTQSTEDADEPEVPVSSPPPPTPSLPAPQLSTPPVAPSAPAPPPVAPSAPAPPPVAPSAPAPPPAPSAPAPPPANSTPPLPKPSQDRSALLSSIQGFNASKLKKAQVNDRSSPVLQSGGSGSASSSSSSGSGKPGGNPGGLMGDLMSNIAK